MADSTTRQKQLSKFLDEYPIPLDYSVVVVNKTYVFWSRQNERTQHNSSSDDPGFVPHSPDDPSKIHHKLRELFDEFLTVDGLIQFWSIVKTGSRCLLATDNQPFLLNLDFDYKKYRLRSHKYRYNIDPDNLEDEEDHSIINGAPANVFRSHLAELILDLRFHQGNPLLRYALECGLMSCFLIPLCDASQSRCVGVLEYCSRDYDDFLQYGYYLFIVHEEVGLRPFKVQKDLLYKTICNLEKAEDEIRAALEMTYELHALTFAQVSIAYEDEKLMKRMALTLTTEPIDDYYFDYCKYCDMLPVKIMDGLAGKALKKYEPHSCKNIMGNIEQPATIAMKKYSSLVICLKSISTGDHVDYVFEFLWPQEQCYQTMIKTLMLTLIGCLPNFKFACGKEFGMNYVL